MLKFNVGVKGYSSWWKVLNGRKWVLSGGKKIEKSEGWVMSGGKWDGKRSEKKECGAEKCWGRRREQVKGEKRRER
jgi:hypothetical protein